jgi:hypothetical protein
LITDRDTTRSPMIWIECIVGFATRIWFSKCLIKIPAQSLNSHLFKLDTLQPPFLRTCSGCASFEVLERTCLSSSTLQCAVKENMNVEVSIANGVHCNPFTTH